MITLTLLVFLLGMRHGFEPDHLAVIDGMTRCARSNNKLSKSVGFLFSFGHGLIIVFITIMISLEAKKWNIPIWFGGLGTWISILSLFFIGIINLYTTMKTNQENMIQLNGPKNLLLSKLFNLGPTTSSYWWPIFLGMLFSLSFDTLSQTMAFSFSAYTLAGQLFPIVLGTIFMFGMMIIDGLNGVLVAHIIKRADARSRFVSRILGLIVGGFSLVIAIYYLFVYFKV